MRTDQARQPQRQLAWAGPCGVVAAVKLEIEPVKNDRQMVTCLILTPFKPTAGTAGTAGITNMLTTSIGTPGISRYAPWFPPDL